MKLEDLAELMGARQRRKLKRELRENEEKLLEELKSDKESVKTHLRDAIVLPGNLYKTS